MSYLSPPDAADLRAAAAKLETQNFAMTAAAKIGVPVEALLHMLPKNAHVPVSAAVNKALKQCLKVAINFDRPGSASRSAPRPAWTRNKHAHTLTVAATGALGGFFGLPGVIVELPVTTTIMLHSIVEIARKQGEDLSDPESALACMEVLALGPHGARVDILESTYFATRAALAQVTREAASYIAREGLAKEGGPALISFLSRIGSRFGLEVGEKAAAELIPVAGAVGGMTLNVLFISYFQRLAEGHFTIRRLERQYGTELVRQEYERVRPRQLA